MFISSIRNLKQYSGDSAYSTTTIVSLVCIFHLVEFFLNDLSLLLLSQ